jgi:hypothetical protein
VASYTPASRHTITIKVPAAGYADYETTIDPLNLGTSAAATAYWDHTPASAANLEVLLQSY